MSVKWLWAVLILAALLRVTGIGYGLPAAFNADEPHIINIAVSFGGGSLNPHLFKYPTLWMYVLFFLYGIFFLIWSGFGLLHSVQQFGEMFVWNPAPFYLIGRLASSVFSLAALVMVYRTGRLLWDEKSGIWAVALLAASPYLVESAHGAKPESMMFFFGACACWFAARYTKGGVFRDLIWCGLMTGLACSSQYTALPLGSLIVIAWGIRREGSLIAPLFAAAAGFALTSPFVLLDYREFMQMVQGLRAMSHWVDVVPTGVWKMVIGNVMRISGHWFPGGLAFAVGAASLCGKDKYSAFMLLGPILAFSICLSLAFDGGIPRYLFAVYPLIALVSARGIDYAYRAVENSVRNTIMPVAVQSAMLLALILPGAWASVPYDRNLLLPDTRTLAASWIESHIPQGAKILTDQQHASPRIKPALGLVEQMIEKTRAVGHPRYKYYELMKAGHPGGGYWVYQIKREAVDLWTLPQYAAFSEMGRAVLDVRSGIRAARQAGIQVVALSSFGADITHSQELANFLRETENQGRLLAEFSPEPGRLMGPDIRIYQIQ